MSTRTGPFRTHLVPSLSQKAPLTRRAFLGGTLLCLSGTPGHALIKVADLRGSIDAAEFGLIPDSVADQSTLFQRAINRAAEKGKALFVPAGSYPVANLRFPSGTLIIGIPGKTRLVYQGDGGLLASAQNVSNIGLDGLTFDGANRAIGAHTEGLLHFTSVSGLAVKDCTITGASKNGLLLDRCDGYISHCTISGAADAGIRSNEAQGLSITDNHVSDCANGGIWIHRWTEGSDGTLVSGNRIERITARNGDAGQWGHGISIFRAHGVTLSGNRISDCAFSAIHASTASNIQITGNTCLRSGSTAIHCDFSFQGALIANNLVDGGRAGISLANFRDGGRLAVCSGNLIRNLTKTDHPEASEKVQSGIGIAAQADTSITGNVIEAAPSFGLLLGWGPHLRNVIAAQNILRQCGTGIAVTVVEKAGPAHITGNIIQGAHTGSIVGYRWREAVTGELDGSDRFAHLSVSGNQIMA